MIGRVLLCDGCRRPGDPAPDGTSARKVAFARGIRRVRLGRWSYGDGRRTHLRSADFCEACRAAGAPITAALAARDNAAKFGYEFYFDPFISREVAKADGIAKAVARV